MAQNGRLKTAAVSLATTPAALFAVGAALAPTAAQAQAPGAKLTILTPRAGDSVGSSTFALDVRFESRGVSPVTSAELWVDGVRWVRRDLDEPQLKNVLSFSVDASSLSEGTHTVLVRVFTADGGSSQQELKVNAGNNDGIGEGSLSGPEMVFRAPGNGKRVMGTVEIALDAKTRAGINPYVTFYIDKQFKTLKNYPPYNYAWDTTTVPNGYHTIEAMGYLESSNASTTRRLKVFVDNPGGNTELKADIPDLRKPAPAVAAQPAATAATATVKPLALPLPKANPLPGAAKVAKVARATVQVQGLGLSGGSAVEAAGGLRAAVPATAALPEKKAPRLPKPVAAVKSAAAAVAPARVTAEAAGVKAVPTAAGTSLAMPIVVAPAAPKVAPVRMTAASPIAGPVRVSPVVLRANERATSKATPRAVVRPVSRGLDTMIDVVKANPVQVAFNGTQIAFDVQPRVEAGLPIAPFRHIFEHTGGQVMWVPESRVVRAVSADREVVITVGKSVARVNGENVSLGRPAFIESGRTIVPLNFVGRALDVDVKYDAATGHIQITSKK